LLVVVESSGAAPGAPLHVPANGKVVVRASDLVDLLVLEKTDPGNLHDVLLS
jgi:hypothetical protein